MTDFEALRDRMIRRDIVARGIRDPAVLAALAAVPREEFVPAPHRRRAYHDGPLPIPDGQTISQPYIVALMAESLELPGRAGDSPHAEGDEPLVSAGEVRVLDVGTGSGYAAAVLAHLADRVFTVERHESLARSAARRFARLGYDRVEVRHGDGTEGWSEHAPYAGILVSAAAPSVPPALRSQLQIGGRLVIPVDTMAGHQRLVRVVRRSEDRYDETDLSAVRFVPLVSGAAGG